jgi:[NiFe] hydrogenase diaphorase moiety large subunit
MSEEVKKAISEICRRFGNDRTRMMDIVEGVQGHFGAVTDHMIDSIAQATGCARVEVESVVTFYAFLSKDQKGKVVIRVCDDIIDRMNGLATVEKVFTEELGIGFGETTPNGCITLEHTPCIGMCDQAPAALVNDVVVTNLSSDKVRNIVKKLRETCDPSTLVTRFGDGNNANELVKAMVNNNVRKRGAVIFTDHKTNAGLEKALALSPVEVINEIKNARLRGRGGAGFPTGMKWEFTRGAEGNNKFVICNADEGEPGTFKDRVILTERADLLFEGMTIAGYAIGAKTGILYLRGEYNYLRRYLEDVLAKRRAKGFLGTDILGKKGFEFDIRIQMGAGAYVCGEETSLISSCEGLRGDPKNRPPFPAQKGFLENPTCVNNVETLCCTVAIMNNGAGWFDKLGTKGSAGTKLLSISGDCQSPGVYEYEFGISINDLLKDVGAENAQAVQVGGPSGQMICRNEFNRIICFDDLATGGSIMVFGPDRDILEVVEYFMDFFVEESCGYCTPCRVGNVLLKQCIANIRDGKGTPDDLEYLQKIGTTTKIASRCGLGQTSPNPVLTTLKNFRSIYEKLVKEDKDGFIPSFDIQEVLTDSVAITGRKSVHFCE